MPRRPARDVSVGALAALALLVLAVGVMTVGEESQVFTRKIDFDVTFPDTTGLKVGSPVKMAGVLVGTVGGIRLPTEPEARGIDVTLSVTRDYGARIRANSRAALRYLQYLSGEKFVEITPGDPASPVLPAGSTILPLEQTEFLEQSADIAQNLNDITISLKGILEPLQRGEGLLGQMIQDPEFGRAGLESFRKTMDDVGAITKQVRDGSGFAGRILFDPEFAATLDDFSTATEHFASLMETLDRREGLIGVLLDDEGAGRQAVRDLQTAADSLKRTALRLEADDNLLGRVLSDEEYSTRLASDLESILANLSDVSGKLSRGEGTIGAMLNERVLYDGLEDVVAGVNDSKFARWLIRHYQKKGIKKKTRAERDRSLPAEEGGGS